MLTQKIPKNIKSTFLYKKIRPYYRKLRIFILSLKSHAKTKAFYAQNAHRVDVVEAMLEDERSKRDFRGIIQFRQSYHRKDFPPYVGETPQYFIDEIKLGPDEVFVDCGAHIGTTIDDFLKRCPAYRHIVAFEPDAGNFAKLNRAHGNNPNITLYNTGVYDTNGEVRFAAHANASSQISDTGEESISVKTIDGLNLDNVTFLKMDIEGAELKALNGAKTTILRDKPKLAICIYHSHEDMIRIAEYIHTLVPEYRLYVRHHAQYPLHFDTDTVLYAIMP